MRPQGPESTRVALSARRLLAPAAAGLALFGVAVCLYARTIHYEFISWDDPAYVLGNPWIRKVSLANLVAIFTRPIVQSYFPLQSISYMLDFSLSGLDPFGYHLDSVLLNALNGALAYWVLRRLTHDARVAFVAALLFVVHPSHVESVVWVSSRKELLFTAFLLLSTSAYLRARRDAAFHRLAYAASLVAFALGLASKTTIATYPLFFLLVDMIEDARLPEERRRSFGFHLLTKLPYLVLALPFVVANLLAQPTMQATQSATPLIYALIKGYAGWRYAGVLLGLLPGQPIYDLPPINLAPVAAASTLAALLIPAIALVVAYRRGYYNVALALAWLMIGLLPPLVIPVVNFVADRYLYAPSLGFCWLLATGIVALSGFANRSQVWRIAAVVALTAFPLMRFGLRTWHYTPVWRNSESMWSNAMQRSRDGRAAGGLSMVLMEQGRLAEAQQVLEKTEALGIKGYANLAFIYNKLGRYEDALRMGERGLALDTAPSSPKDVASLEITRGLALWRLGRRTEAVRAWEAALRADPQSDQARDNLARAQRLAPP